MVNIGGINLYLTGLIVSVSFLWGAFVFYKKSLENHLDEGLVLDIIVLMGFWGFIFGRIGFVLLNLGIFVKHWGRVFMLTSYPGLDRWFVILGFILALLLLVKKRRHKYFDFLDSFALGYLASLSIYWPLSLIMNFNYQGLALSLWFFVTFVLLWGVESKYRFFEWYRGARTSARTGFVFGVSTILVGLSYLLEHFLYNFSFDLWVMILSLALFVIGLVMVYIRSGRLLEEDLPIFKKWKKTKTK